MHVSTIMQIMATPAIQYIALARPFEYLPNKSIS